MKYLNYFKIPALLTMLGILIILTYDFSYKVQRVDENLSQLQYEHLEVISKEPHPVGSEYHSELGNYIKSQISSTTNFKLQTQEGVDKFTGINVKNILAFKNSTDSNETIMISAHYDSEPGSYGANDDGLAIASMLTIMQKYDEKILDKNLLLFFSDAEEQNLAGARYFVENDNDFNLGETSAIYNFEARGAFGPIYLFESVNSSPSTTANVINQIKVANNHQLTQKIYERLPNNSDLSILKDLGAPGYNFGYFRGLYAYHTPEDNLGNTSIDTREQQLLIMDNIITNLRSRDLDDSIDSTLYFSLISGVNFRVNKVLLLAIFVITYAAYSVHEYRKFKDVKINFNISYLKSPVLSAFTLGLFTITLNFLLNYFMFFNYIGALMLTAIYISTTGAAANYMLKRVSEFARVVIVGILGLLSLLFLDFLYLVLVALLIAMIYKLFKARFASLKVILAFISIVLINFLIVPFIWELVWLYDNRFNTLLILLFTSIFLSMLNVFIIEDISNSN